MGPSHVGRDGFGLRQPPRRESRRAPQRREPRGTAARPPDQQAPRAERCATPARRHPRIAVVTVVTVVTVARAPQKKRRARPLCSKQSRLIWRDAPPRAVPTAPGAEVQTSSSPAGRSAQMGDPCQAAAGSKTQVKGQAPRGWPWQAEGWPWAGCCGCAGRVAVAGRAHALLNYVT
jgi:hypothetical protein